MGVRTGRPVAPGVEIDQLRVDLRELLIPDTGALRRTGPHAVKQDVSFGGQSVDDLLGFRSLQV
jgi:hypothetical protein